VVLKNQRKSPERDFFYLGMIFAKRSLIKKLKMKSKIHDKSASELAKQRQKRNFKTVGKNSILLFLLIAFVALASGQVLTVDKQKAATSKDTIKKSKMLVLQEELTPDSLFVETGKFKLYKKDAHASYYADKFNGKRTASGRRFDNKKFTAAHKKLPFGTKVKVTNEANGKSVIVEVIDRGPFVRTREIDLSRRAFMQIAGNKSAGNMLVTMEVLQK
jgi:rare lipoprotein A